MAATISASLRSTSRFIGDTAIDVARAGSMRMSMSVSSRPKALALVTGTKRPALFGKPVGRGVDTAAPPTFLTSTVLAEHCKPRACGR